jgi:membrane protease YdiL (CAAX protease family)
MLLFTAMTIALTIAVIVGPIVVGAVGADAFAEDPDDPLVFTLLNLSLAALIPAAMFTAWAVHRVRPGFVSSVIGRLRWKWLAIFTGVSLLIVIAVFIVSGFVLPADPADDEPLTFVGWATYLPLLAAIVLTTPLQAAGEEYAFRGYLSQAIGAWAKTWRWVPVLITGFLFALAHGSQNPALFTDRFMFGVGLSIATIVTGGLEAAIAMHTVNNVVGMVFASAIGDLDESLTTTGTEWAWVGIDAVQLGLFLAVVVLVRRRGWMQRLTTPGHAPIPPMPAYPAPSFAAPVSAVASPFGMSVTQVPPTIAAAPDTWPAPTGEPAGGSPSSQAPAQSADEVWEGRG